MQLLDAKTALKMRFTRALPASWDLGGHACRRPFRLLRCQLRDHQLQVANPDEGPASRSRQGR